MSYSIPWFSVTLLPPGNTQLCAYWRKYSADAAGVSVNNEGRWFGTPAATRTDVSKSWSWTFAGSFMVPSGHASVGTGYTFFDMHNTSYDVGNTGFGGIGWGYGDLVSSMRMFFDPATNRWAILHQPNYPNHDFTIQTIQRDVRYDFIVETIFGRLDQQIGLAGPGVSGGGVAGHPNNGYGRTRVWVNGSNTPLDTGNINTLQRGTNPNNGFTYTQTIILGPWDGWYTGNLSQSVTSYVSATRMGRSLGEALVDGSVNGFPVVSTTSYVALNNFATSQTPIDSSTFQVPSSLGGVAPPTPTSHTGPWTPQLQWNASEAVPEMPPTVVESNIGPWTNQVRWNAHSNMSPHPGPGTLLLTPKVPISMTLTPR